MNRRPALRTLLATCAATALTATLAACGGSDDSAEGPDDPGASTVRVEHRFGTTEVPVAPERIVTLDLQWTDTILAMGVQPVAYGADSMMPDGEAPWWESDPTGEALNLEDGVPLEKIAALEPDLIVATYSIGDQSTYDRLSELAPTIAGTSENYVAEWPKLLETAGQFLDKPALAGEASDAVQAEVDAVAADFPRLRDKTFALAQYVVGDAMYVVADEDDGSSKLFRQLGMTLLPSVVEEGERSGQPRIEISTERADLLTADFLAFLVNGGDKSDLHDIPGFAQLPASKSGAAAILDYPTIVGLNTPTPLSIPYALDQMRPYLKRVA